MEAIPKSTIKDCASRLHKEHLKPLKFKKKAMTWYCDRSWPLLINLQSSRYNTTTEAQFTLNLGVFIPELHEASLAYPIQGFPTEPDCYVRSRIGHLMPEGTDKWWKVTHSTDPEQLFNEVSTSITEIGIPWLEQINRYSQVAKELLKQKKLATAALALKFDGKVDEATDLMCKAYSKSNKYAKQRLLRIASNQQLPIRDI